MTRNNLLSGLLPGAFALSLAFTAAAADRHHRNLRLYTELQPTNEVPALSSTASGFFRATINENDQTITYELTYQNLEAAPTQGHIHVGQRGVNGGITVWFCGNPSTTAPIVTLPAPPVPQPQPCPAAPATITGVLTPADIVGPAAQGIAPTSSTVNEFDELVDALRSGVTYVNVHSVSFPGGEIRGQVKVIDSKGWR